MVQLALEPKQTRTHITQGKPDEKRRDAREDYCSGCRRKKRNSLVSLRETHESKKPMAKEIQSQKVIDAKTAVVQTRRNSPLKESCAKCLESQDHGLLPCSPNFPKNSQQLEEKEKYTLRDATHNLTNEPLLEVCIKKGKDYKGDMMDYNSAKLREEEYAEDPTIGSYMYFFRYKKSTHQPQCPPS
ncbi:unnamed protein product [Cylicocyclus nassatus]|uniref:Uncharacterized protein n=1 Tax=Cylicocyclus nassatus TaxID=53992 RepID=A0AA36GLK8_CYLNA|nr:unnamed protein product [Cylicocyclus nassatus]